MVKYIILPVCMFLILTGCGDAGNATKFSITSDVLLDTTSLITIAEGTDALDDVYTETEVHFFDNTVDFDLFYTQLLGAGEPIPSVDFMLYRVVALVLKEVPTTGYDAEIVEVSLLAGLDYNVTVSVYRPRATDDVIWTPTKPYHIIKVAID